MNSAKTTRDLAWRKSSYSGSEGGQCLEVAAGQQAIHVRDSKNTDGPTLTLTPSSWVQFVDLARSAH